jgi:Transmembrane protein of unknown function (DUF3556)
VPTDIAIFRDLTICMQFGVNLVRVGFLQPNLPVVDMDEWRKGTRAVRTVPIHLSIRPAFPMGVPLEWNVFMIFWACSLFVTHTHLGLTDLADPWPVAVLFMVIAGTVVLGSLFPRKVSFLPACCTTPGTETPRCVV